MTVIRVTRQGHSADREVDAVGHRNADLDPELVAFIRLAFTMFKYSSIVRGCVGTALSAADNAELRRASVAVFPPLGRWHLGSVPVFDW